ncbi:hypothetical protein DFH06DRAFT_1319386 [Mycena polygramma]|nr:hypothetical protein DFH06DRAFT_1319386 [Mycena polygramma]
MIHGETCSTREEILYRGTTSNTHRIDPRILQRTELGAGHVSLSLLFIRYKGRRWQRPRRSDHYRHAPSPNHPSAPSSSIVSAEEGKARIRQAVDKSPSTCMKRRTPRSLREYSPDVSPIALRPAPARRIVAAQRKMEEGGASPRHQRLPQSLVPRATTGPPFVSSCSSSLTPTVDVAPSSPAADALLPRDDTAGEATLVIIGGRTEMERGRRETGDE